MFDDGEQTLGGGRGSSVPAQHQTARSKGLEPRGDPSSTTAWIGRYTPSQMERRGGGGGGEGGNKKSKKGRGRVGLEVEEGR